MVVNRDALLELLSNTNRTFSELPAGSRLHSLREDIARGRAAAPAEESAATVPTPPTHELGDMRLDEIPELSAQIENAHLYVVASFAGGDDQWVAAAAAAVGGPAGLDAAALERLVAGGQIEEATAHRVGFIGALYETVERDTTLTRIVREARFSVSDGPARSTLDLARTSHAEWESALRATGPSAYGGTPISDVATVLADRFAAMHPGPAFIARLATVPDDRVARAIADVEPVFARNEVVFGRPAEQLDLTTLDSDRVTKALAGHALLQTLIVGFPDLQLQQVLDDRALAEDGRRAVLARRIGYVKNLQSAIGEELVLFLDFGPRSADLAPLTALAASPEETAMVLRTLKTHQRAFALGGDPETASRLLARGFPTARSIASLNLDTFRIRSGSTLEQATTLHERATRLASDAAIVAASLLDVVNDPLAHTNTANLPPSALDYLRELDGFEQLFGSLSFCACEECNSILGPAAYFVDLMRFVDDQARPQFATHPNHPLDLKTRRPDLWTLPLTCKNTRDRLPILEIVDEILEAFIAKASSFPGSADEQRRRVYETLATTGTSFALPFHLPVTRVDLYLEARTATRAEVARALGQGAAPWASARLKVTTSEHALITTPDLDIDHHRALYGVDFQVAGAELAPVDVQDLRRSVPLDREELSALIATSFVTASGTTPRILAEKRTPESLQNDIERVHGLSSSALDRMHRLVRIQRHLPWTFAELDGALSTLGVTELSPVVIVELAKCLEIQGRWSLAVDDVRALIGAPSADWLDRVFRSLGTDPLPQGTRMFIHPAFRSAPTTDAMQTRLAAALGASHDELEQIIRALAPDLARATAAGFDPSDADEDQRGFLLSAANLTLLYRHVRIARLLGVSIPQLGQLCALAGIALPIASADTILALAEIESWRGPSGYRLDDLAIVTGAQPRDPSSYPVPSTLAAQIANGASAALTFEPTLFALSTGVSESASREILAANPTLFARVGSRWRIADTGDLTTLVVPASAIVTTADGSTRAVTVAEVRGVLDSIVPSRVLAQRIADAFSVPAPKLRAIAVLAGADLANPAVISDLLVGPSGALEALIASLIPFAIAVKQPSWDAATVEHVANHRSAYGIGTSLVLDSLHALALATATREALSTADASELTVVLESYKAPPAADAGFPPAVDGALARVLDVDLVVVRSLRGRTSLGSSAPHALDSLRRAAHLARDLGVDGAVLAALVAETYSELATGDEALVTATRAVVPAATLTTIDQEILERRRDALAAEVVQVLRPDVFRERADLSAYFLIDVEAGGCQTSSRVIAATGSVQQYVHRLIMRLEQDRRPADDPDHLEVGLSTDAVDEWSWRKNYRVWEANRKVFLWPENYLEPDLRDDKTPLFAELEQELLQGAVSDQSVLDAYSKYLAGFEELANLTIAGAYHDVATGEQPRDVLHLFGVSNTDPPTFYYRTADNLTASGRDPTVVAVWTPWRKLTVQITGRRVSPVVFDGRLHVFWTDYKTRSRTTVVDGGSEFDGYQHTMRLRFTTLRLDGTWTPPQDITLPGRDPKTEEFALGRGIIHDWLIDHPARPRLGPRTGVPHTEALDDYTLSGPNWDWVWPEPVRLATRDGLFIGYRDFLQSGEVDLYSRELVTKVGPPAPSPRPDILCARGNALYYGSPFAWDKSLSAMANLVIERPRLDAAILETPLALWYEPGLYQAQVATLEAGAKLLAVPGNVEDAIVQVGSDVILLQGSITRDHRYIARRIGTTLATRLARTLFSDGIDGLLDIETQKTLREAGLPLTATGGLVVDRSNRGTLDFKGPYGTYFREIYFHIPAILANHLNSQGQFASAQRWYHYIFDPTATEMIQVPATASSLERERLLRDRVWRCLELRGLDPTTIRAALTDPAALEKYRRDPFNPHAIARLRITAYQKGIVMRYVDNLLDWADHLFTQFTMESVNEAAMLYLTASDILGARPAELGPCSETTEMPRTYESIAARTATDDDLLVELESWMLGPRLADLAPVASPATGGMSTFAVDRPALVAAVARFPVHWPVDAVISAEPDADYGVPTSTAKFSADWSRLGLESWSPALAKNTSYSADLAGGRPASRLRDARSSTFTNASASTAVVRGRSAHKGERRAKAANYATLVIEQLVPTFCVPPNTELHAYWDRVDDRLFKIRHCMDISGQVRELALTEPPIDPRLLVHGAADGIALDSGTGSLASALPPYRFSYLIERAKSYAATLQGFGNALLGARERKDAEEMSRLSVVHQKNIASLSTRLRDFDIGTAQETLAATEAQRDAAVVRRDFYQGLLDEGNNGWETSERISRHLAASIRSLQGALDFVAAISTALPQIGSPFAMKYGGVEVGGSASRFALATGIVAAVADSAASSAAMEGNYARRNEGWRHQRDLARRDVEILERQIKAASLHVKYTERSLAIHERSIEQLDAVSDLMENRFSNLGRFTWLAQQLQRLHRTAYDGAMSLARLAEQAFRFERDEEAASVLEPSYWDAGQFGLLAGERLFVALQTLERRFLETNDRTHEIDQPVSLGQIDPAALIRLRESGTCDVTIPELAFDLFYPGHYKRRIKGVRLTIPCITGPYVNVSTTLELLGSKLRRTPAVNQPLVDVPPRRTTSIATSTAQNDGGVFEMSFRDERYLPFEGAGAISSWRLSLPSTFRPFDYSTITDVIISISYTAEHDGVLRTRVESTNAAIEGSLLHFVHTNPLTRVLSLRQDFSAVFTRLIRSPPNTDVRFEITDRHFPLFAQGKALTDVHALLAIRTKDNLDPATFAVELDGAAVTTWTPQDRLGGLRGAALPPAFTSAVRPATHTLRVTHAGALAAASSGDGALDVDKILDVFLVIDYKL